MTIATDRWSRLRAICLSFPEVTERPSHSAPTFFVRDKKSFVMLWADRHHQNQFPHPTLWRHLTPDPVGQVTPKRGLGEEFGCGV